MWFETRSFIHHVAKCFIERVTHTLMREESCRDETFEGEAVWWQKGLGEISEQLLVQGKL